MAVTYAKEMWPGRDGSDDITRKRDYPRIFEVVVDSLSDDATVAGGPTSGCPRLGDPHPNDSGALCVNVSAVNDEENPYRWIVTCTYSTELPFKGESQTIDPETGDSVPTPNPASRENNPVLRLAKWKYSFRTVPLVARKARHGLSIYDMEGTQLFGSGGSGDPADWFSTFDNPGVPGNKPPKITINMNAGVPEYGTVLITNSAGDPFDPPIEVEDYHLVIDITWFSYGVNHTLLSQLIGSVNDSIWYKFEPRTCRVTANEAEQTDPENGFFGWQRHVQIEVNPNTWDLDPMDRGTREFIYRQLSESNPDPNDPTQQSFYKNFLNTDGSEATEFLNGNGRKLPADGIPVIMYYRFFSEQNFALLGIPT